MLPLDGYDRYAIFWAPLAGSGLACFGSSWLGWDAESGKPVSHPVLTTPLPLDRITRTPRRYGFHATLKAPFRLAEGKDAASLDRAAAALAARTPPASAPRLEPGLRLGFLSLMPGGAAPQIDALAASCVRELDPFRAPASPAELARRRAAGLTRRQERNLRDWGYPYVMADFRFHLTLSGRLDTAEAAPLTAAATLLAQPHLEPEIRLREICLFGDPGPDRGFRLLRRYPLTG